MRTTHIQRKNVANTKTPTKKPSVYVTILKSAAQTRFWFSQALAPASKLLDSRNDMGGLYVGMVMSSMFDRKAIEAQPNDKSKRIAKKFSPSRAVVLQSYQAERPGA